MRSITCFVCKDEFGVSDTTYAVAIQRKEDFTFCCPHGHKQHFVTGETELDKMRRERDRLAQRVAQKDDEIKLQRSLKEAAERQAAASKGQVTKLRNRTGAGTCPCCNRTFRQMALHMQNKHPTFRAEHVA